MYDYNDYFADEKSQQPYLKPGEELEDYLRLLDMILENYVEYKKKGNREKLFSRGLVITESEMSGYFDMPPYFRERDICNPVLAMSSDMAFDYIANRVAITKRYISQLPENEQKKSEIDLLRINSLISYFDLNKLEFLAILMAFSVEIDRRYERIFGFLQDNVSNGIPTTGLLYALMSRITPREGAEDTIPVPLDKKMYTYFFIRKDDHETLSSTLVLQPLVVRLLMGVSEDLKSDSQIYRRYQEDADIPMFFDESAENIAYILDNEDKKNPQNDSVKLSDSFVYLASEDEETPLHLLFQNSAKKRETLFVLDLRMLEDLSPEKQRLCLSELYFMIKIQNGRLAVRCLPFNPGTQAELLNYENKLQKFFQEISQVCSPKNTFLYGEREEPIELAALLIPCIRIPEAPVIVRAEIWDYFLNAQKGIRLSKNVNIPDLADFYEITYGAIQKAVGHAAATSHTKNSMTINRKMILDSLQQLNQVDFSGLATYVKAVYTWKDITITDFQRDVLKTACNRYRLRNRIGESWGLKHKNAYGNGVSLLLYGPPGTGKTMAAQVVANELELPLYRVDISQISSKYIGETEKNLATIFKAAATANVILFFDEADALFSKRTEVSDSHDKYANNETAYLLQKIEEYNGMSILATNYYNNFDDAFVRRITYAVHMESPDKETRYMLWRTILPKSAKMERNIDFHFFADNFELSGSNIKAILFNAAYMAGAEGKPIGAQHIVRAMQYEFNKLGKLVSSSDFGKYAVYL